MNGTIEHKIRERAYEIWHATGRAHGKADEHWIIAERELTAFCEAPQPPAKAKTRRAPARKAKN